ncbi:hypothetical protein HPB52_005997 [Rhipicephalus sanguineus]|uniref:Uncharacterized protein n=1 Tax=Rhipicephalus sanguineus TaxID=34632 RepID=A0A9D4PUJ5_RHISA|nr:hypothetical protein HPB52_005997 [Rhipicephalus sanguineus]
MSDAGGLPFVYRGYYRGISSPGAKAAPQGNCTPQTLQGEGACIYCILLTVVGLMGRMLPPAVAAMLPIVILPLGDVYDADQLATEYMGPHVLTASILFAVAFLGDETTVFFRLCLHVIQRWSVRLQPLYFYMQFLVLALSLLLPSNLIVIFSTVFIERFVTTVHNEIVGSDQRSVVRIQPVLPSASDEDDARRPRWRRRSSTMLPDRRARSVSMDSEVAGETSGNSSLVKQGRSRLPPPTPTHQPIDTPWWGEKRTPRKTSFGAFIRPWRDVDDDSNWSRYLPVRRIRSFSMQNKPPSSILKRSPSPPPPSPLSSPSYPGTSPVPSPSQWSVTLKTEERKDSLAPADALSATTSRRSSPNINVWHDAAPGESSAVRTTQASPSPPQVSGFQRKASAALTSSDTADNSTAREGCVASSHRPSCSNVDALKTPSPKARDEELGSPSAKLRPKAIAKHGHGRHAVSSHKPRHRQHSIPAHNNKRHSEQGAQQIVDTKDETRQGSRRTSAQKSEATPPPPKYAAAAANPEPAPEPVQESRATQPRPAEPKQPEVRGVLKKRSSQLGSSAFIYGDNLADKSPERVAPFENDNVAVRALAGALLTAGSELPVAGRRSIQRTSMSDMKSPLERGSNSVFTGSEQPTLSWRVRALTTVARPAFIASAAYTAIFGNIASFSTLPARKTVLVTLGCDDSIDEQTHRDMSKCALVRHKNMNRHTIREALLSCWLIGIPVASSAYAYQQPGNPEHCAGTSGAPLLVAPPAVLEEPVLSHAVGYHPHARISHGAQQDRRVIVAQEYRLVEVGLEKLDDHFWAQRSARSSQFILVSVAAVLSEVVVGDTLARSMATTVVRVAVVTETPISFYVVPVSLVACINVMLPVSLPLLVMREYLEAKCAQMLGYGILLKCVAVVVVFISMNTVGLVMFQSDQPPAAHAIYVMRNVTDVDRAGAL